MIFPVVMYGCENWTIKKTERQRIDAFQLQYWRRLLRVPRTARRSNQSILKEINPEYSSEGLMLKLQYFDHLMRRADSLEKTLMQGKIEGRRRRGRPRMRWVGWHHRFNGYGFEQTLRNSEGQGSLECNPEIPAFPGEENQVPDTRLGAFSSCSLSFQHQGLFQWVSSSFISGGQSIGVSATASVIPMNIQG